MENNWYRKGLKFKCTECGQCCTGAPGYVWVTLCEIEAIANFLKISLNEFMRQYVRRVGQRYSLVESKQTFDCIFLKDKKCQIYGARPVQCKTYPWWPQNLRSKKSWEETALTCEGIHENAPLVECETIEEQKRISEENHGNRKKH